MMYRCPLCSWDTRCNLLWTLREGGAEDSLYTAGRKERQSRPVPLGDGSTKISWRKIQSTVMKNEVMLQSRESLVGRGGGGSEARK